MRYSQDLPLEEQQRLDQIHLNQGGVSPYRNGLNNENSGLNSMFPPRDKIGHHMVLNPSVTKSPAELMEWAQNERRNRRQKSPEEMAYYINIDETQGNPTVKDPALGLQRPQPIEPDFPHYPVKKSPLTVQPTLSMPTTMPLPQPPVMPTPSPPTTGGPFGGGGKTFLNRFERLLDGLEGLVGKLGADGNTPESPFSSGGGGLSDAIETPFTPTQDY